MSEIRLVSEDRRRGRVRPTRLALVSGGVVLVLAVALIVFGIRQIGAGRAMRPVATPTAMAAAPSAEEGTVPTPEGCPTDRAQWHLVPYSLPGSDTVLYAVDPPCVMEQAEQVFREYLAYYAEHGRNWTAQDHQRFYSPAGFTAPVSGDVVPEITGPLSFFCTTATNPDGTPAEQDAHVAFYTISEDGLVADVLYVSRPHGPYVTHSYDCETGELTDETSNDGEETFVLYQPMVYGDGRWRLGHRYDVYHYVPSDQTDPQAMLGLILDAQGRDGP